MKIYTQITLLLMVTVLRSYSQNSFSLPTDGKWYKVASISGQHGYLNYVFWHSTGHNPSMSKGEIEFINSKNIAIQHHQTMGYGQWNQLQFALLNLSSSSQLWVKATDGTTAGTFKIMDYTNAVLDNGATSDTDLSDNGGTLTVYNKLEDNTHQFVGKVQAQEPGALTAPSPFSPTVFASSKNGDAFVGMSTSNEAGRGASLVATRARDNAGSLSQVLSGDIITGIYGAGYTGSSWSGAVAAMRISAAENFTTTAQGTQIDFATTPIGGTTRAVRMMINPAGRVGIGTISPQAKLDIDAVASNDPAFKTMDFQISPNLGGGGWNGISQPGDIGIIFKNSKSLVIAPHSPNVSGIRITSDGNVGIGTSSPNQKLTVNGTVYGKEVKVDLNVPGPDYVFEPTYNLPTLAETEAYIKANKHLPEVPSAKEMAANGINLSEMNMLLLKKVEELTLHLIEANKRIENADKRIKELELSHKK